MRPAYFTAAVSLALMSDSVNVQGCEITSDFQALSHHARLSSSLCSIVAKDVHAQPPSCWCRTY